MYSAYRLHVVADNATIQFLHAVMVDSCTNINANRNGVIKTEPRPYTTNSTAGVLVPQDAVQYYRASSVVLLLEGYNNTDALLAAGSGLMPPIPAIVSPYFLRCVNETIGTTAPLVGRGDILNPSFVLLIPLCIMYILKMFCI